MEQYRQGDVWIERIYNVPGDLTPVARVGGRIILAAGEVTGHHHAVVEPDTELFTISGVLAEAERILRVGAGGATVVHEEHGTIALPPGDYRVIIQQEWTDEREPRRVLD